MNTLTRVKCGNCGTYHSSANDVRLCYFPPAPQRAAATVAQSILPAVGPTQRQLDYIRDLGGDVQLAARYTQKGASLYIDRLKKEGKKSVIENAPNRAQTKVPLQLLHGVPDGYFAVRQDSNHPYTFLRVSRPKSGNFKGALKIQTQHGPDYKLAMVVYPGDRVYWHNKSIEDDLLLLVVDYNGSAIAYFEKIGRCMRCNTELTDDRSRWFGIGPECEKHWPHIIDLMTDRRGPYRPGWDA